MRIAHNGFELEDELWLYVKIRRLRCGIMRSFSLFNKHLKKIFKVKIH